MNEDALTEDVITALTHLHLDVTYSLRQNELHPELQLALTDSIEELEAAFPFLVRPV